MAGDKSWTKEKIKERIDENELDLSLCQISKVPVKFMLPFTKVTTLDLSCNKINVLPENFPRLVNLVQLDLSKNSLTELPHDFGELIKLKKLDLLQNHISELPLSFRNLKNLVWLDLKANPIQENLPNVVGDCLKPKECQLCAQNVRDYYENIYRERLENERKAKKREEIRIAKQLKEENALRQRKKEEKKKRQEERKLLQRTENNAKVNTSEENENLKLKSPTGLQGSSSGYVSYCRILLFLLLIIIGSGITLLVMFKGDIGEVQKFLTKQFTNMMDFAQKKYKSLKSHVS